MKQILLAGLLSASALGLTAASSFQEPSAVKMSERVAVKTIKSGPKADLKRIAQGVTMSNANGIKKLHSLKDSGLKPNKIQKNAPRKSEGVLPQGYVLFESFEGWDGENMEWTPDGWTVDMRGEVDRSESWTPTAASLMLPSPADGSSFYGINYSLGKQDEWLVSPEVQLDEDMMLSYWLYLDPLFLYNLNNVDWDAYEFLGDKEVAATLQIWVQPEGEEWQMIHDYADDYKDLSLNDLRTLTPSALEKKNESLARFAGKKVKVGFRYVGSDGNTMLIDAIGIGYPALEDISYMDPFSTLYWGFDRSCNLVGLAADIAQYPVYEPLTWTNMSWIDGATFSWQYCDPITAEFVTSDDPDQLTVTYVPDYTSKNTLKNNFFYPPTLNATAPHATPGSYTAPYVYFQAGGKAERTLNDGSEFEASLLPFGYNNSGLVRISVDDPQIGDSSLPVFGHNVNSNQYWLNYTLNGEPEMEGDYSHLEGIANLFFATEAPLVVNGLTVYGYGRIAADAEFTATIYGLNSEMSADFSTFTEIAKTTIKGSDILTDDIKSRGYLAFPFDFESPVVVRATEEHPAYVFMFSGFNSDKVEYFAPIQSYYPDPNGMCLGYILNHIDVSNHTDRDAYYSFKPMVYKDNGEYVDPYGAFAIGINGEYPWLTTDCNGIYLSNGGSKVEVALGSYYDGSRLTVEVPAGVEASVAGRYDECVLTVAHNDADVIANGEIVVKGPGVEVTIPVKEDSVGVESVAVGSTEIESVYNLSGNRVSSPENGVYIIKYTDGTVRKMIAK